MGTDPPRPPSPPAPANQVLDAPQGPKRPWWQRGWGAAAIGIVGVLVGAGIGAAGKGSTKTVTEGAATTVQRAKRPTHTVTVTRVVVHNHTKTVRVAAPSEYSGEESSGGGGQTYSGSGTKNLGTITVSQPSVIHWRASGDVFGITNKIGDPQSISLLSKASSGDDHIAPGTYHEVEVSALEDWSFTISPG